MQHSVTEIDPAGRRAMPPGTAALMPVAAPQVTRPPRWRSALGVLGGFAGGAAIGGGLMLGGREIEQALVPGSGVALSAGCLLSLWPQIVIHEAGHAVAGLSRGMHAIAFGVGPLRLERGGDDRWRWRRGGGIGGVSGFAALLPRGGRGQSRADQIVFALGGPLANLATAALCLLLVWWLPGPSRAVAALLGVALAGLCLGIVNLLPFHTRGWRSDGRGVLDLLRRTPDAALQMQVNQLMALSLAGVRARDWPDAAMPAAEANDASSGLRYAAPLLRIGRAIDRRDATAARIDALALTAGFNAAPASVRPSIAVTLASHAALLVGDRALVAAWRRQCEGGLLDLSPYRAWLDAEIARLDGDIALTAAHVDRARALAGRIPDAGSRVSFDERLDALMQPRPSVAGDVAENHSIPAADHAC